MRPGLDSRFLRVGPSGWHHIGGQNVELTLYRRRGYRIVFRTWFLDFHCIFELCRLYLNLLCKTCVVN